MNTNIHLAEQQKEQNKIEANSKLIKIILEKIMEEKENERNNKNI